MDNDSLPVVKVVPFQAHCFAFGGFELQMLNALQAAGSVGVNIERFDAWSRSNDFDVLHFWGMGVQHLNNIDWTKRSGKKVVLSVLTPYATSRFLLRGWVSRIVSQGKILQQMLSLVDAITVVNTGQKEYLLRVYNYPEECVFVVPNIVEDIFYDTAPTDNGLGEKFSKGAYVVCSGNLCTRKNQLMLVKACIAGDIPLVLVGGILTGEESYGQQVIELISGKDNIKWLDHLRAGSPELSSIIKNAGVFALVSHYEQQPISALEAVAAGVQVVMSDRPFSHQLFYENACLVDPDSEKSILGGVARALQQKDTVVNKNIQNCKTEKVGMAYRDVYEFVCGTKQQ